MTASGLEQPGSACVMFDISTAGVPALGQQKEKKEKDVFVVNKLNGSLPVLEDVFPELIDH